MIFAKDFEHYTIILRGGHFFVDTLYLMHRPISFYRPSKQEISYILKI